MSAFVLGHAHITAMVDLCLRGPQLQSAERWQSYQSHLTDRNGTETGRLLLRENIRSVNWRYHNHVDDDPDTYTYRPSAFRDRPTAVEGLKLLDCYDYQACEHPEWEQSEAFRLCDELRLALIWALPGYEEAPWEWIPASERRR